MDFRVWTYRWAKLVLLVCFICHAVRIGDLSFVLTPAFLSSCVFWLWATICLCIAIGLLGGTRSSVVAYLRELPEGEAMAPAFRAEVTTVLTRQVAVMILLAVSIAFVPDWAAHGLSGLLVPPNPSYAGRPPSILGWWGPAAAIVAALFGIAILSTGAVHRALFAFRLYGRSGFLSATMRMAFLRTFGPPKDFFEHVPLVRSVAVFSMAAFLWADAPTRLAGAVAALCLIFGTLAFSLSAILPPTWLFLSASDFRSFQVFRILRFTWAPRNGITLLNRFGRSHLAAYTAERDVLQRSGALGGVLGGLYSTPERPRIWSIRVRDDAWEKILLVLLQTVPLIIVDIRGESRQVVRELRTILHHDWLGKTLLIGAVAGDPEQLHEILREKAGDRLGPRIVTEESVVAAVWSGKRLLLPSFAIELRV